MTTETTDAGAGQSAKRVPQPLTGAALEIHRESRANREYWRAHHVQILTEHPGKDYLIVRGGELLVFDGLRDLFEAYDQLEQPTRSASFHVTLMRRPMVSGFLRVKR